MQELKLIDMPVKDIPLICAIADEDWLTRGLNPSERQGFMDAIAKREHDKTPAEEIDLLKTEVTDLKQKLTKIEKDFQELKSISEEMTEIKQLTFPFTISGNNYILDTIIEKEGEEYVAFIPDLGIASQGDTVIDALQSLKELTEFYFEDEDKEFIKKKLKNIMAK